MVACPFAFSSDNDIPLQPMVIGMGCYRVAKKSGFEWYGVTLESFLSLV